jgi:hypothetical protein
MCATCLRDDRDVAGHVRYGFAPQALHRRPHAAAAFGRAARAVAHMEQVIDHGKIERGQVSWQIRWA